MRDCFAHRFQNIAARFSLECAAADRNANVPFAAPSLPPLMGASSM